MTGRKAFANFALPRRPKSHGARKASDLPGWWGRWEWVGRHSGLTANQIMARTLAEYNRWKKEESWRFLDGRNRKSGRRTARGAAKGTAGKGAW